ncbi:MAG: alpha/beta hydrolase [Candidatus Thorarchaeota archaeon]|nr:alpha/beta hydrolase [Candidatus Thorarchaeota archaeon]
MNIHFEELGDPDDRTLIFVHGAGGSSATWFMQLRGLSDQFHVVAIDLNGHGKSPDRNEADITKSYLDDIHSLVTKFDHPILGGHSMGGALTQLYALENPDLLSGIILIGTGGRLKVLPLIFELLENDFDAYVDAVGIVMFDESTPKSLITASQAEVRKCPPAIIARDFHECNRFDFMEEVGSITVPTLILVGESDQMTPVKYSTYMDERIKDSKLETFAQAGHSVMLEKSSEVNLAIIDWSKSKGFI